MSDTANLNLPCLEPAQAQKHVTVNEALTALDALVQLSVKGAGLALPPEAPEEGARYIVAEDGAESWDGHDGDLAAFQDGSWHFYAPRAGWRAWDEGAGHAWRHDGESWQAETVGGALAAGTSFGAALTAHVIEAEHELTPGWTNDTALEIPDRAVVLGVTGRVTEAVTGATSWCLGVDDDPERYGNSIGVAEGSTVIGISGTPVGYYGATPVKLTAAGGAFTGGAIRLALHYLAVSVPGHESA